MVGLSLSSIRRIATACVASLVLGTTASVAATNPKGKSLRPPDVRSSSVLVIDREDSSVLLSRKADLVAPIASITKLMTALVVLDEQQSLDEVIEINADDRRRTLGNASRLAVGAKLSRGDLLRLALMSSENRAAHALGRSYPGGEAAFVKSMNVKAKALGMSRSNFVDPSGLSSSNVASAADLVKLVIAANRNPVVREYSTSRRYTVRVGRQMVEFHNTNALTQNKSWNISVQKTGYISEAGQCLVMQARIDGRPVVIVLLNSWGKYTRVADAKRIRDWMEAKHPRGEGGGAGKLVTSNPTARRDARAPHLPES